jgi:sterol desaturase/sphingolipid hydroxylase (fatty acid hydroxylase superfamily)
MNPFFDWLLDPGQRTHYVYWVSTLLIALIWASLAWGKRKHHLAQLLEKDYWLNTSSYQDVFIAFFNRGLFLLLGFTWLILTLDIALLTLDFLRVFGDPAARGSFSQHSLSIVGMYTLLLFLLDDASRFLLHRLMHKFNFLWRIHQLHHSASTLTPLTTLRLHPLESLLYQIRSSLIHGICAGFSFFYFGFQLDSWQVWGATAWVLVFNFLGANLRHSQVPLSYGPLEKIFISPAMHQAHHGLTTMNNNYGSVLSIWDRLMGSWRSGKLTYKLPEKAQPLMKQLLLQHIKWK